MKVWCLQILTLLGLLHVVLCEDSLHTVSESITILDPRQDSVVPLGETIIRYKLDHRNEDWPWQLIRSPEFQKLSIAIYLDGQRERFVPADECIRSSSYESAELSPECTISDLLPINVPGPHVVSVILFISLDGAGQDQEEWDAVGEASVSFEAANANSDAGNDTSSTDIAQVKSDQSCRTMLIVFDAPSRRRGSFIDPHNVVIRFHVEGTHQSSLADVEISGRLVASLVANPNAELRIPYLEPNQYTLSVFLKDQDGARTSISESQPFFVWPDHSWVKNITADGAGLSAAFAGEASTFTITSRDRSGAPADGGGDWFVARLVGPSIVSAEVTHTAASQYGVSYMVGEEGEYDLYVELHYDAGAGLQDFGDENPRDLIGWHIVGSPFKVYVRGSRNDDQVPELNPYVDTTHCASTVSGTNATLRSSFAGRWVSKSYCKSRGLNCWGMDEPDDEFVWLPWYCSLRGFHKADVEACVAQSGSFRVLMAGTSQQRTLFFDVSKLLGSTANQPRKYWSNLVAGDTKPHLYFHWMIPGYDDIGDLDYTSLIATLHEWVSEHIQSDQDVLVVQASVHDIHLGSLAEYQAHIQQLAQYLARTKLRVLFRSGDALHVPPAGRSIIERGLRDPRIRYVNEIARRTMSQHGITFIDTHASTIGRPDKCIDGYHYFDRDTETLDQLGMEICIGNSVARTQAQIILNFICPPNMKRANNLVNDTASQKQDP